MEKEKRTTEMKKEKGRKEERKKTTNEMMKGKETKNEGKDQKIETAKDKIKSKKRLGRKQTERLTKE